MITRLRGVVASAPPPVLARWIASLVAVPPIAAAAWMAFVLVSQVMAPSRVDGSTVTLAEAAAFGSNADIVRLLRAGADPNAPARVRRHVLREIDQRMTPLEAAAAGRTGNRRRIMGLLVDGGAILDSGTYPVVWCLADSRDNPDALAFVRERLPDAPPPDCGRIRTPW